MSSDGALVRRKLLSGQVSLGSWLQIASPTAAEIMANSGFEWLALDCEHGLIDLETAGRMIAAIEQVGVVPFVRVPVNDPIWIRRMLDAGAGGVIVPMVDSPEQAAAAVAAAKYPPEGVRGFGFCRANGYGLNFEDYVARANESISVVVQIEHIEGVRRVDEIVSTPGVDGTLVGPYDLSGSMGIMGQMSHPEMVAAMETVVVACQRHGVAAGLHVVSTDPNDALDAIERGFTFVALGMDDLFLQSSAGLLSAVRDAAAVSSVEDAFSLIAGAAGSSRPKRRAPEGPR